MISFALTTILHPTLGVCLVVHGQKCQCKVLSLVNRHTRSDTTTLVVTLLYNESKSNNPKNLNVQIYKCGTSQSARGKAYRPLPLQFHAVSLAREVGKLSDPLGLQKPVRSGDTCAIVISGCASDGVNEVVEIVHLSLGKRPAQP